MQPYFFPYAAYFSLLANVDEFVIFDCVQFARRARIHRAEVPGPSGKPQWLTLPIEYSPRETLIRDIRFAANARLELDERLEALGWIEASQGEGAEAIRSFLHAPLGQLVDFLEASLQLVSRLLRIDVPLTRSSTLDIDPALHGQERVVEIVKRLGGVQYVNPTGGRNLYDASRFNHEGIRLGFMPKYDGPYIHMLHALMTAPLNDIRQDVMSLKPEFT